MGPSRTPSLREIIFNTINYLKRYKPKIIVVASNTPSVQVLDEVKKMITDTPIIGVQASPKRGREDDQEKTHRYHGN